MFEAYYTREVIKETGQRRDITSPHPSFTRRGFRKSSHREERIEAMSTHQDNGPYSAIAQPLLRKSNCPEVRKTVQ
ncbi:MAG: hypothetical protein HGA78_06415 [Nitrospirales bacterium]|nr:hypothetical protein [Nitrospirales bacterium]